MLENSITDVTLWKELAKYYRDRADRTGKTKDLHQESLQKLGMALSSLQKAIELLDSRYKLVEASRDDYSALKRELVEAGSEDYDALKRELVEVGSEDYDILRRELADCYGIQGGIYRRYAFLEESKREFYLLKAAQSYKNGISYEVGDSYNLFNHVVIHILREPDPLEKYYTEIQEVRNTVQEQVQGSRADQWWAWADLGLIDLLLGKEDEALSAYHIIFSLGTRAQDYDSALSVLHNLEEVLHTSVSQISQSVVQSMRVVISLLETNKAV